MQDDATKNAYAATYTTSNRQLVTERPFEDVIYVGDSISVLEVAIPEAPTEIINIQVVLPNKREGKKLEIINSSAESDSFYMYFLIVSEVVNGELVPLSIPNLRSEAFKKANFVVEGNVWTAAGATAQAAIGTLWNTVKNGTILFFGFGNISEIYKEVHYTVPYDCPYVGINDAENVESKDLQLVLSQDFKAANKFITIQVNLTGTAKHVLEIFLSGDGGYGLSIADVPNGIFTFRCVADASYGFVISWLPLSSVEA